MKGEEEKTIPMRSSILLACGRFGSRIFGLFPRKCDAVLRRIFGMSENTLIWGTNPKGMDIGKADPETTNTARLRLRDEFQGWEIGANHGG